MEWAEKNESRPFCSERCRLIDFGEWANERRAIAGEPDYSDEFDEDLLHSDPTQNQ